MVGMLVGYKDVIGLRHGCIIDGAIAKFGNRINLYLLTIVLDTDARMHERMELNGFATLGGKLIYLVRGLATGCADT
jgi:hypothetical protein